MAEVFGPALANKQLFIFPETIHKILQASHRHNFNMKPDMVQWTDGRAICSMCL